MTSVNQLIAGELGVREAQVEAAVALLDGGATVPFIARYRKEATGSLDDSQLRLLEERLGYLRELRDRRASVLESIRAQGKLTPQLAAAGVRDVHARDKALPAPPRRRPGPDYRSRYPGGRSRSGENRCAAVGSNGDAKPPACQLFESELRAQR